MSDGPDHRDLDPAGLLEAAAGGDARAFEELARRYHAQAYRIARRILGGSEEAADVVQKSCLRLWQALPRYRRARGDFGAWYLRMVVNLAIDQHRRLRLQRRFEVAGISAPGAPAVSEASATPVQEAALSASEVERVFERVAAFLTPQQRAAFTLVEIEGIDSTRAAEVMGVAASTVRNHVHAAREVLRAQMRRLYPEYCRGRD
jgi:RNA polymerase sigma-70 factor (ECF subfamily)